MLGKGRGDAESAASRARRAWRGGIAGGHRVLEVGRRGEQRGADLAVMLGRPVDGDHHAGAMRDEDHGAIDLGQGFVQRGHACRAAQLVMLERLYRSGVGNLRLKQGLPVLGHVVAQAGNEQYGGVSQKVHCENG
jgi:hypothetical protein